VGEKVLVWTTAMSQASGRVGLFEAGAFQDRLGCDAKKANPKEQENKSRLVETVYLADIITDLTCQRH
jgi:hypothetical protein